MSVHFQHSGLSSSCTECRAGGQVLLPTVSSDPCSAQGLEGRGTQAFRPESQSPLFLHLSLTVQGTHQLRVAGQMPRCPCSCETFLNTSRSQTTPSAKSSKQTQCPVHLSPKAKSRSLEVFWVLDTLLRESSSIWLCISSGTPSPVLPLQALLWILEDLDLDPSWTPEGMEPPQHQELIWTRPGEASLLLSWGPSFSIALVVLLYRFSISFICSFIYKFCMYLYVQCL